MCFSGDADPVVPSMSMTTAICRRVGYLNIHRRPGTLNDSAGSDTGTNLCDGAANRHQLRAVCQLQIALLGKAEMS